MKYRKLRIAWSVVWLACLGLVPPLASEVKSGKDYTRHEFNPAIGWPMVAVIAVIIICAWIPLRFSLRTLLIATTLVGVGLGLIVWAAR